MLKAAAVGYSARSRLLTPSALTTVQVCLSASEWTPRQRDTRPARHKADLQWSRANRCCVYSPVGQVQAPIADVSLPILHTSSLHTSLMLKHGSQDTIRAACHRQQRAQVPALGALGRYCAQKGPRGIRSMASSPDRFNLTNKTIALTGGGRGLGLEVCCCDGRLRLHG